MKRINILCLCPLLALLVGHVVASPSLERLNDAISRLAQIPGEKDSDYCNRIRSIRYLNGDIEAWPECTDAEKQESVLQCLEVIYQLTKILDPVLEKGFYGPVPLFDWSKYGVAPPFGGMGGIHPDELAAVPSQQARDDYKKALEEHPKLQEKIGPELTKGERMRETGVRLRNVIPRHTTPNKLRELLKEKIKSYEAPPWAKARMWLEVFEEKVPESQFAVVSSKVAASTSEETAVIPKSSSPMPKQPTGKEDLKNPQESKGLWFWLLVAAGALLVALSFFCWRRVELKNNSLRNK